MREKMRRLLARFLVWVLRDEIRRLDLENLGLGDRISQMRDAATILEDRVSAIRHFLDSNTMAVDHHLKSDSWVIVGIRGRGREQDIVRMYPVPINCAHDMVNFLRRVEKEHRIMVDSPVPRDYFRRQGL